MATNILRSKKFKVVPIRRPGGWLPVGHDGDSLYSGARFVLSAPMDKYSGQIIDPLKDLSLEEKESLAKEISRTANDLSVHKPEKNFWLGYDEGNNWKRGFEVVLDKNERVLDLKDPMDFIAYKVLLANSELIAPSANEKFDKGGYRFALVNEEDEVNEKVKSADKKKEAYKHLGKLEQKETSLRNFLRVYGHSVAKNMKKDAMVAAIDKIIDNDIDKFLSIVADNSYEMKLFILDAVDAGAMKKTGNDEYSTLNGKITGSLVEISKALNENKNQHEFVTIKARLEAKE